MDRIRMKVKARLGMHAFWKTGGHDIGYDGCGAHTHKGIWKCPEVSNLQSMIRYLSTSPDSFLANTSIEVKATFFDVNTGYNNPLYYIQVRSGNEAVYRTLVGEDAREAVGQAGDILKKIEELAEERSVTMLQSQVEYNPRWLQNS